MANIIFDLDGTLWDARENILISWNKELQVLGYPKINMENLTPLVGKNQLDILMELFNISKDKADLLSSKLTKKEIQYLNKSGGVAYPPYVFWPYAEKWQTKKIKNYHYLNYN